RGTHFTVAGGWTEGHTQVGHDGFLEEGPAYTMTSGTQGLLVPNIGVTQDLRSLGLPGTFGLGVAGLSGIGAEFRGRAPEGSFGNSFSSEFLVLGVNAGAGVELTDRLAVGASLTLGIGFEQLGLVQSTAMVHDYALRGNFGFDYDVDACSTMGVFYQTELGFNFPNAFRLPDGSYRNIHMAQPQTVGLGLANHRLCDGNLLLAADIYCKLWEDADLYENIFVDQWAFAFGTQLTRGKMKYRLGYSYNTNPINHKVGDQLSGLPVAQAEVQFFQAANTAVINQHRLTAGFGREDFLFRGVDLDFFAGGLFNAADQFGPHTTASVALYYLGLGLTWRYGEPTNHQ
ncbi:MAG TPA: hypothetical protein VE890_10795, partial [Thermoguttaceae bacterium]|nr:hypothetical protein [Thermoguttaceae bacterium]